MPRTPPLPPGLIERTAVACARLDAAASRSVVRDGWLQRSRIDGADQGFGPAWVPALPPDFDGLRRAVAAFVGARQSRSAGILLALADGLSAATDSGVSTGTALAAIPYYLAQSGFVTRPWPALL